MLKLPWKPGENRWGKHHRTTLLVSHFSASFWGVAIAESLGMFVGLGNGHMKKGLYFFYSERFFMNIDFKPFFVVISSPWVYNIYI